MKCVAAALRIAIAVAGPGACWSTPLVPPLTPLPLPALPTAPSSAIPAIMRVAVRTAQQPTTRQRHLRHLPRRHSRPQALRHRACVAALGARGVQDAPLHRWARLQQLQCLHGRLCVRLLGVPLGAPACREALRRVPRDVRCRRGECCGAIRGSRHRRPQPRHTRRMGVLVPVLLYEAAAVSGAAAAQCSCRRHGWGKGTLLSRLGGAVGGVPSVGKQMGSHDAAVRSLTNRGSSLTALC